MSANINITVSILPAPVIGITLNSAQGSQALQLNPPDAQINLIFADIGPQGPAGPSGGGGASTFTAENKDSVTLVKGMAVTQDNSGTGVRRADCSVNAGFSVGLAQQDITSLSSGPVQTDGILTLSDWTAIIGSVSLTPKTKYYLDANGGGKLTATAPTTPGYLLQRIGISVDAQTLEINLGYSILL